MSDYAPECTKRERVLSLLKPMLWFVVLSAATELWLFDWLIKYSDNANCYYYGNITGVHLIMYGLFVGIPLSLAIILAACTARSSIGIIKLGQYPLPGEKVLRKTKYIHGRKAKMIPVVIFLIIGLLLIFSLWGAVQAYKITQNVKPCEQQLTSCSSIVPAKKRPPLDALTRAA